MRYLDLIWLNEIIVEKKIFNFFYIFTRSCVYISIWSLVIFRNRSMLSGVLSSLGGKSAIKGDRSFIITLGGEEGGNRMSLIVPSRPNFT